MTKMNPQPIKGKLPILMALLILVLAFMWMLGRCSRANEHAIGQQFSRPDGDTLVVAIEISPTSYTFSNDSIAGFDYEMLKDIAEEHGLNVVFQPFVPVDYALNGLKKGDFDMVVATLPSSSDLGAEYLLTDDVFIDRQVLVTRKNDAEADSSATPPQFRILGDTVCIAESSPFRQRLANLSHELGDTIYVKSSPDYSAEHLVLLTALGEIKQAVVNESVARRLAAEYADVDISTPISLSQFQPWIVSSSHEVLRDSLNRWIQDYKATERYQQLTDKYLR